MENIEPLTNDENWILHCSVDDVNWRSALSRLTLPEVKRILEVEVRKTAISKLMARKRQLEKEYAETELYECEYSGCEARIPWSHAIALADGTMLCKPCNERAKLCERQEQPQENTIIDDEDSDDEDNEDNDDNGDNDDDEERDPQTSLDQFFK